MRAFPGRSLPPQALVPRPGALLLDPAPAPAPAAAEGVIMPAQPLGRDVPIHAPAHHQAQRDPAGVLPAAAAARLMRLRVEQEDGATVASGLNERHRLTGDHRRALIARRDAAMRAARGRPSPATTLLDQEIATATSEIEALAGRIARAHAARSDLPRRLTEYVRSLPSGIPIEEHRGDPAPPKTAKGQSLAEAVQVARERLAELAADAHQVASAPLPSAAVKASIRNQVAALAAAGAPDVGNAIEIGAPIAWPRETVQLQVGGVSGGHPVSGFASGQVPDAFALMVWLHRDALVARLEAEVDELADDAAALTDVQRATKERQIAAAALEVERRIEGLIELSEREGAPISRDDSADPRAVLGLASTLPAPAR